jgi:hypothetical protein
MRNILLTLLFTAVLGVSVGSCAALEGFFGEGTVFTTQDQLAEGEEGTIIPFDQLPDSVKEKIPEGTSLVMANKDQLVADAAYVPAGGDLDGDAMGGMIDAGFGIAKTFIPALAAWEGVVTMFSRRKRKHYVKAAKSLIPTDKNMDLGGAVKGVAAALGLAHSTENSKAAFEEDEEEELV